jgi:glycerol-3-phosphate dehydrogenase (NAD(P)+)
VSRAAVLGAGAWGTAFAKVLAEGGADVTLWARRDAVAEAIRETGLNEAALPGIKLPERVTATSDLAAALDGAGQVYLAVPSQTLRGNMADWAVHLPAGSTLVSLMKGIELGTTKRMSQVIVETARVDPDRVVVVSGPNLAPEIAAEQPAATVVASTDKARAQEVQQAIALPYLRPYTSDDVVGCELGGAVKNVIALAYGMASAMGMGDNTKASLITRGLAETARLGVALGADPMTFAGLAGLGDLVATCSSPLSRNRHFGELLGQGRSVEEIVASTRQVAEGVKSCESIRDLSARHGVYTPIIDHVAALIRGETSADELVTGLLSRATKSERD